MKEQKKIYFYSLTKCLIIHFKTLFYYNLLFNYDGKLNLLVRRAGGRKDGVRFSFPNDVA